MSVERLECEILLDAGTTLYEVEVRAPFEAEIVVRLFLSDGTLAMSHRCFGWYDAAASHSHFECESYWLFGYSTRMTGGWGLLGLSLHGNVHLPSAGGLLTVDAQGQGPITLEVR